MKLKEIFPNKKSLQKLDKKNKYVLLKKHLSIDEINELKKMDTSKKNLFVKRHDMRQRMIEPTTVTFVRKLKSEKLQFMSQADEEGLMTAF